MKANRKIILLTALATSATWVLLLVVAFWVFSALGQSRSEGDYLMKGLIVPNHTHLPSALIIEQDDPSSKTSAEVFRIKILPGTACHLSLRTAQYASVPPQNE